MTIKVLYTARATAVGGRNGHTQADDGLISVDLSIPKAMGGPGRPTRLPRSISLPPAMPHALAARASSCRGR